MRRMRWRHLRLWGSQLGCRYSALLVRKEPAGLSAGALAEAVGCPHNTLSTHIAILARAGLVKGTREGPNNHLSCRCGRHARSHRVPRHRLL